MTNLQLHLLGKPEVLLNNRPVTEFETNKAQALLYYLAVTGCAHSREVLADLLWGDMGEATAKRNLTKALSNLRHLLEPYLLVDRQSIAFNQAQPYELDVTIFQASIEASMLLESGPSEELSPLRKAVNLYRGDFLEGFHVREALAFEEWHLSQREQLRETMLQGLDLLVKRYTNQRGEEAAGLEFAARLLALDPWRESAHRQMMVLLARSGRRSAALAQYESCRRILAEELGVEPMAETTVLYERLKASGTPPHNLTLQPTLFVGREAELRQVAARLDDPHCRVVTLVGPGGIGKTRLALQAAARYLQPRADLTGTAFTHGVYFVNLAPLKAPAPSSPGAGASGHLASDLATAVAAALKFSFQGPTDLLPQLLRHLHDKTMLLILDNFEHLLPALFAGSSGGVTTLSDILQDAPQLKLLVTSRERLNLQEEWVVEVGGLEYPLPGPPPVRGRDSASPLLKGEGAEEGYSAIAFFTQRAEQVRADFALTEPDMTQVVRICQLVEGSPLALELAASWLRVLSCAEIVAEIEQSLDFLTSSLRNSSERHRSMRAIFEQSWQMLSHQEQAVFRKLSVFRGGFQREAAQTVAGASLPTLASLADKSLLRLSSTGRYEIHELLRQFAAEKLLDHEDGAWAARPSTVQTVWERYSSYYLKLLGQYEARLCGQRPQQAVAVLRSEVDNIRQAWHWAVVNACLADLNDSLGALAMFYELLGLFQEGEEVFGVAGAVLEAVNFLETQERSAVIGRLWLEQARFVSYQGQYKRAKTIIGQVQALAAQANEPLLQADTHLILGLVLIFLGELDQAVDCLQSALAVYQRLSVQQRAALALSHLGEAFSRKQRQDEALIHLQQALRLDTELGNKRAQAFSSSRIGNVYAYKDMNDKAMEYYKQALAMFEELDDTPGVAKSLSNIGLTHYYLGEYAAAFPPLNQALQLFRKLGDIWGEANTLENLGMTYLALGEYQAAQQCLDRALALSQQGGSKLAESYSTYWLGKLYLEIGAYPESRTYLQQAIALAHDMGDPALAANCRGELGRIYHRAGNAETALTHYSQAIAELQQLGERFNAAQLMVQKAVLLFEQGQIELAQTWVTEGIRLAQAVMRPQTVFDGQLLAARIGFVQGDQPLALQQLHTLLRAAPHEANRAAVHYELWKLGQGPEHAHLAHQLYEQLYAQTPNSVYHHRIAELQQRKQ
ncbi:MAG: tetratricopeptide repeat protein [Anaerolineae bacterium]|nr:tetratricopeptide repeat protein [Anaerolineae bacterium]